jgi:hypothetical protein
MSIVILHVLQPVLETVRSYQDYIRIGEMSGEIWEMWTDYPKFIPSSDLGNGENVWERVWISLGKGWGKG